MRPLSSLSNKKTASLWSLAPFLKTAATVVAITSGLAFGYVAHCYTSRQAETIPLAFSEIGKMIQEAEKQGTELPALTEFYAKTNDFTMSVFECHNAASKSHIAFASELDFRLYPSEKIHKQIPTYTKEIPALAEKALKTLSPYQQLVARLPRVRQTLAKVWDEEHIPITEEDDSDPGDFSSDEIDEDTQHKYYYDKFAGERADQVMRIAMLEIPSLNLGKQILRGRNRTDAENEYAIEKTMKEQLRNQPPTESQALYIANTWARGANYTVLASDIRDSYRRFCLLALKWHRTKNIAASSTRTTAFSEDSGPEEYQIIQQADACAETATTATQTILYGINFAKRKAPTLEVKIRNYVATVLDHKPGDPDKQRDEIMTLAKQMYKNNFAEGLPIDSYNPWLVAGATALGAALGYSGFFITFAALALRTRRTGKAEPAQPS